MTQAEKNLIQNIKAACKLNRPPSERFDYIRELAEQLLSSEVK
jgi:hypothetical protein